MLPEELGHMKGEAQIFATIQWHMPTYPKTRCVSKCAFVQLLLYTNVFDIFFVSEGRGRRRVKRSMHLKFKRIPLQQGPHWIAGSTLDCKGHAYMDV